MNEAMFLSYTVGLKNTKTHIPKEGPYYTYEQIAERVTHLERLWQTKNVTEVRIYTEAEEPIK